ncbi:MAG: hypothetical protein AAFW89_12240 [Bacteroidota bacterium]
MEYPTLPKLLCLMSYNEHIYIEKFPEDPGESSYFEKGTYLTAGDTLRLKANVSGFDGGFLQGFFDKTFVRKALLKEKGLLMLNPHDNEPFRTPELLTFSESRKMYRECERIRTFIDKYHK